MKKIILAIVLFSTLTIALPVFSQGGTNPNPPNVGGRISNPLKDSVGSTIPALLNAIVDQILIPIGAILAVLAFIWAGFKFVTAQGSEPKIDEAKRALLYAAVGTAILLGAKVITTVLKNTLDALAR